MPRRDVHNELLAALIVLGVLALLLAAGAILALSLNGSSHPTATVIVAASTNVSPTVSGTNAASGTTSPDSTSTATTTPTRSATVSATATVKVSHTITASVTGTSSSTANASAESSNTATRTNTASATNTLTRTPAHTSTLTPSPTDTLTLTSTITPSLTDTLSPTLTDTLTPSLTDTLTPTLTDTLTPSLTDTVTPLPTITWTPLPTIPPPPSRTPTPIASATSAVPTQCIPPIGWQAYIVQPGDTLFSISLRARVSMGVIEQANCITDPSQLRAGQILYLPPGATMSASTTPTFTGIACGVDGNRISYPPAGSSFNSAFSIRGSASIPNFAFYKLEISAPGMSGTYKTFLTGNSPITGDGLLGTLDPAPYVKQYGSGTYYIHLIVVDQSYQVAPGTCTLYLQFTQ